MDDAKKAMLGDCEAQKRLTYQGVLLPCVCCGNETVIETKIVRDGIFKKRKVFRGFCKKCRSATPWNESLLSVIASWNTRAPLLTTEQIKRLEEMEDLK